MVSSFSRINTTNAVDATAKATTSTTKGTLGTRRSSNLVDLKSWMDSLDDHFLDAQVTTGIKDINMVQPQNPLTEEEELQKFIRDYIDEPPPRPQWKNALDKMLAYTRMYSGRGMSKIGYHNNYVIMDECVPRHEKTTLKPTKKQAKLLKKFRKLKRFK